MCFSPTASFVTAGLTGAVGLLALARTTRLREAPIALVPLVFAAQQAIEGGLWLTLPTGAAGATAAGLTLVYLLFAQVFWPVYAPAAAWLIEPQPPRRRVMLFCIALGACVGGYFLWRLLTGRHQAEIVNNCIVYRTGQDHPILVGLAYLAATAGAPLLSSRRAVFTLGALVLAGSIVAFAFYWQAFLSVWCFFAAAASLVILGYVEVIRRQDANLAAA